MLQENHIYNMYGLQLCRSLCIHIVWSLLFTWRFDGVNRWNIGGSYHTEQINRVTPSVIFREHPLMDHFWLFYILEDFFIPTIKGITCCVSCDTENTYISLSNAAVIVLCSCLTSLVNSYSHVGTVSWPNHTFPGWT